MIRNIFQMYDVGEAAMYAINKNQFGKTFFHLGPLRDTSIYEKVKDNKADLKSCDFILCTGLFDEHGDNLNFYKKLLENHVSKKLVCTNPDLTVHKGNVEELCAGSVAKVFEDLGGQVVYFENLTKKFMIFVSTRMKRF